MLLAGSTSSYRISIRDERGFVTRAPCSAGNMREFCESMVGLRRTIDFGEGAGTWLWTRMTATEIAMMEDNSTLLRAEDPVRVLVVDYSIGFGGATKSMGLMLREMRDVEPVVLTSQKPDVQDLWYGAWRRLTFRSRVNYRSRWRIKEWAEERPLAPLVAWVALRGFAMVDTIVTLASAARMVRLIRRERIDIVHLANGFGPPESALAARLTGVPLIAHLRGFYRGNTARAKNPRAYRPTLVIGDSQAVTDSYRSRASHPVRSTTLLEVVDVAAFDRACDAREEQRKRWALAPEEVAVGIFGRVVPWKGQMEYAEAMIQTMRRDERIVGVIVGDASDGNVAYLAAVRDRIKQAGLMGRFRFTGYVEDVESLYSAMDMVVHASIEPEPCGMVVMEAMAARRPIIAADRGGPLELVRNGVDGWLVDPTDTAALSAAMEDLAAAPERRVRMGTAGYHRARTLFDVPIASARLREIYQELIGRGSLAQAAVAAERR